MKAAAKRIWGIYIVLAVCLFGLAAVTQYGFQQQHAQATHNHLIGIANHHALCNIERSLNIPDGSC